MEYHGDTNNPHDIITLLSKMTDLIIMVDTSNKMLWEKANLQAVKSMINDCFANFGEEFRFSLIAFDNNAQVIKSKTNLSDINSLFDPGEKTTDSLLNRGGVCNFFIALQECDKLVKNLPNDSTKIICAFIVSSVTDKRQKNSKEKRNRLKHIPFLLIKEQETDSSTLKPFETFILGQPDESEKLARTIFTLIHPDKGDEIVEEE